MNAALRRFRDTLGPGPFLAVIGVALTAGAWWAAPERTVVSIRQVAFLLLEVCLCGPLIIAIGTLTGARWLRPFTPLCTRLTQWLPVASIAFLTPLVVGLFLMEQPSSATSSFRSWWLDPFFLSARAVAILASWWFLARRLSHAAQRRTETRSGGVARAAAFLVVFGPTFWVASVDWVMALSPHWQSTLFPFYCFAGFLLTAAAVLGIAATRSDLGGGEFNGGPSNPLHDASNLLLFASCFWAYLWFSQYLLIWYAAIPEESLYFVRRTTEGWLTILVVTLCLNWAVPFLALLARWMKRDRTSLLQVSLIVILGRWVDRYQLFLPEQGAFDLGRLALDLGPTLLLSSAVAAWWRSVFNDGGWVAQFRMAASGRRTGGFAGPSMAVAEPPEGVDRK